MTLNETAYRLLAAYRANIKDSDPIDIRLIKNWIRTNRAKLIKQRLSQPLFAISDSLTQALGLIEIEEIDSSIVPNLPAKSSLFRTIIKIPRTIDRKNVGHSFIRIGPADRLTEKYDVLSLENALRSGYGRFNRNDIISFILDDRLYLYTRGSMVFIPQYIDVIGIFEDPIMAGKINDPLYDDDSLYPITESIIDDLESLIFNGVFKITINQLEDKVEDNEHKVE
jgi:hypothetical protein